MSRKTPARSSVRPLAAVVAERYGWPRFALPAGLALALLIAYAVIGVLHDPVVTWPWTAKLQITGAALTYVATPTYLMACCVAQDHRVARAAATLVADFGLDPSWIERARRASRYVLWTATVVGFAYGALNYGELLRTSYEGVWTLQNASLIGGNAFLWAVAARALVFRIASARQMSRFGREFSALTMTSLDRLRPFAQVATFDVLIVMGALALMPLQALDAEFRWVNYEAGLVVGIAAATALFVLPMIGIRGRIRDFKRAELERARDAVARSSDDITRLEPLLAYRDRVRAVPTVPIDVRVVTRVLLYFVIPPLAWVAAALVETWVSGFVGG